MDKKFKIFYVVKFFNGLTDSGCMDVFTSFKTTKEEIQMRAMAIVMDRWTDFSSENKSLNIQKVDLTVSEIK